MNGALLVLCLAVAPDEADLRPEDVAFLEILASRSACYVREPVLLRLRFGLDTRFLKEQVVSLFPRTLDVPVQVLARWPEGMVDAPPAEAGPGPRFVLDDQVAVATSVRETDRDGRRFTVLEVERRFRPLRAGEMVIPAPRLRFAYATRFEDDLLQGRVAVDRREATVTGVGLSLKVQALPTEGRPPSFTGAIGSYSVQAEAGRADPVQGESFPLVLTIEGEEDPGDFEPPRLDDLPGFHVLGRIEEIDGARRIVTYDLAVLDPDVSEVPAIPFTFFETRPTAGYRTVRTSPIPLRVQPGETDAAVVPPPERDPLLSTLLRFAAPVLASLLVLALCLVVLRRRRRRPRPAAAPVREDTAPVPDDAAGNLSAYLARRLGRPAAAVIDPQLAEKLASAGVPPDLAARAASLLEELVAARYGGTEPEGAVDTLRTLLDELDEAFARQRAG